MKTVNGESPSVSSAEVWVSLIVFVLIFVGLGAADVALMLRYAREGSRRRTPATPRRTAPGDRRPRADLLGAVHAISHALVHRHRDPLGGLLRARGVRLRRRHPAHVVGRTDTEQRVAINTIGPWWDGNEVWLIVAGAATFAAFPAWYATMFSALYLALLLVLAALIVRGVAFEFRGKREDPRWRADVEPGADGRQPADPAADRRRARRPAARAADRLRTTTSPATSWTCSPRTGCGPGVTLLVLCLLHGCHLPRAAHGRRRSPTARTRARPAAWAGRDRAGGRLRRSGRGPKSGKAVPGPVQALAILAVDRSRPCSSTASTTGWAFTCSAVAIARHGRLAVHRTCTRT